MAKSKRSVAKVTPPPAFDPANRRKDLEERLIDMMVNVAVATSGKKPSKSTVSAAMVCAQLALSNFKADLEAEQQLDGKFYGVIWRRRDDKPEQDVVCFVPRDKLLTSLLEHYKFLCSEIGGTARQVSAVHMLIERCKAWRESHSHLMKVPDVAEGEKIVK